MIVVIFGGKDFWFPDLPDNLDVFNLLYDFHFLDLNYKKDLSLSKQLKKVYNEEIPLSLQITLADIKSFIKNKDFTKVSFPYTIFSNDYVKVIYHPDPFVSFSGNTFPTPLGYIAVFGYDKNKNESYKAYILRESSIIKMLNYLYNLKLKHQ
ncbi:MAG: hypothetical protein QXW13_00340 [Nanopusillaceae archaeon]